MHALRWMAVLLTVAALDAFALAQDTRQAPAGERPGRGERPARGEAGGPRRPMGPQEVNWTEVTGKLNLTDAQKPRVEQMLAEHQKAVEAFRTQHAADMQSIQESMQKAREAQDREAMAAARAKMEELNKQRRALDENLVKQLGTVLTPEQTTKLRELTAPPSFEMMMLRGLNLTPEQEAKAKQILDAARAKADAEQDPAAKRQIMQEAMQKIQTDVLTEEQRTQMRQRRGGPRPEGEQPQGGRPGRRGPETAPAN